MKVGFFKPFHLLISLVLLLSGCVKPVVENYTQFQDRSYSARDKPAEVINSELVSDLMASGYLLIGHIDFKHNIQSCYENLSCKDISENQISVDELQKSAANKGADRIQLLYSSLELVPDSYSVCNGYTTTTYTDSSGKVHTITVCASYSHYQGFIESWNMRALLWRYEPELASADNNYQAVQKAYAIINKDTPTAEKSKQTHDLPLTADTSPKKQDVTQDLYGAQLVTAIDNGNLVFLEQQLKSDKLLPWQQTHQVDLLMLALEMRKPVVVEWLLQQDVAWEQIDSDGYMALEYAVAFAEPDQIKQILRKAPALKKRFSAIDRIYKALALSESPEMLEYLLKKGFSVNGKTGEKTLLVAAIVNDNTWLAQQLIAKGAHVQKAGGNGVSPLNAAVVNKNSELISLLVKRGAKVNSKDRYGNTALHYAAMFSSAEVVEQLIDLKAKPNVFNKENFSPLYTALAAQNWQIAETLMQQNIKYKAPDTDAFVEALRGLLFLAPASTLDMYLKQTQIIRMPELKEFNSSMVIACAEHCGEEKMAVFFDNGVNLHYAPEGKTLFRYAYDKGNIAVLKVMIKRGYRHVNRADNLPTSLDFALISGDKTLVTAYRMAEIDKSKSSLGSD